MSDTAPPPACHGLIAGWRLSPEGAASLDERAVERAVAAGEEGLWLHFDLVDVRARAFIQSLSRLSEQARAALVEVEQYFRIEEDGTSLFGALPDLHFEQHDPAGTDAGLLHFALAPGLLVTSRRHPLRGVHEALQAPQATTAPDAFGGLLHATVTEVARVAAALTARLGRVEDSILRPSHRQSRRELTAVRRAALRLTRHFGPLNDVADLLREDPPEWLTSVHVRREARQLKSALRALDGLAERARLAQDALDSAAAEETNRRLFVLSVISAAMLPASLVAGIFGMNVAGVPGVPDTGDSGAFIMAMGVIVASIGVTLASLKLFRML
jgi:zinc transporter